MRFHLNGNQVCRKSHPNVAQASFSYWLFRQNTCICSICHPTSTSEGSSTVGCHCSKTLCALHLTEVHRLRWIWNWSPVVDTNMVGVRWDPGEPEAEEQAASWNPSPTTVGPCEFLQTKLIPQEQPKLVWLPSMRRRLVSCELRGLTEVGWRMRKQLTGQVSFLYQCCHRSSKQK